MDKIQLIFSRSSKKYPISTALIRLGTWSSWSHVGIVIPNRYGPDTVIEARGKYGVREITLDQFLSIATQYEFKEVEVPDAEAGYLWAKHQVGKPYDYWGVIGLAFHREWDQEDSWWCSELAEACIKAAGRKRFIDGIRRLTPQHVWMVT